MYMSAPHGMYNFMQMGTFQGGMSGFPADYASTLSQGKGKAREADFEAAFAEFAAETQTSRIEEVGEVSEIEEALKNASLREGDEADGPLEFLKYVEHTASGFVIGSNYIEYGISSRIQTFHRLKKIWPNGKLNFLS